MSERYGNCATCAGHGSIKVRHREAETGELKQHQFECSACGGTGHSGDAMDYVQSELDQEWEHA